MRPYDLGSVKSIIMKFIWLVHVVIFMIGQTAPCWDQINEIIWVAHLLQRFFKIVSLIPISTVQDLPLHCYSQLEIGMGVISIHIYLICIFVVNGSRPSSDSKVTGKRVKWDFPFHLEWGYISARSKNDWMDIKLHFSLWWSGLLIPRLAMMTWKYTWNMDMCLSIQLTEIMSKWRLSALIMIWVMIFHG